MASAELQKKYEPVIYRKDGKYRTNIPGVFGSTESTDAILDKVISHSELVGIIASHDPVKREVTPIAEGTSGAFVVEVFRATRDLDRPEHKRKVIKDKFKYVDTQSWRFRLSSFLRRPFLKRSAFVFP